MWNKKQGSTAELDLQPVPEPVRSAPVSVPADGGARPKAPAAVAESGVIGGGVLVKGEISGTDALLVDGRVEGSINIPGERVTVAKNGEVIGAPGVCCILAREIVIMGHVKGNISASDKVEIRAEGALTGDVSTARVSIEDGAFFRGGIDIRGELPKSAAAQPTPERVAAI